MREGGGVIWCEGRRRGGWCGVGKEGWCGVVWCGVVWCGVGKVVYRRKVRVAECILR